ncbi:MAG: hypothetical protein R2717_01650 [Schumannella sp.]|nr:hypothetical protein [Microbacteriaceae bacterium]
MDAVVRRALDALSAGDGPAIREALHPYLHWTRADGTLVRGRSRMLEELDGRVPAAPASIELRDGQIYRWVEPPA